MSGSDLQGRWMPSSVTEEDILKLHEAKYLAYEVSHRLPAPGQAVPAPEPPGRAIQTSGRVLEHSDA